MAALKRKTGPTMLSLTRQDVPVIQRGADRGPELLHRGAYIIMECEGEPDIVILTSGSEVHISIAAAENLKEKNIRARVVSFPCWELFDEQPGKYRDEILAPGVPKAVVEAGIRMGWEKYAGGDALFITMETFGLSAPAKALGEHFGFTVENIVKRIVEFLKK